MTLEQVLVKNKLFAENDCVLFCISYSPNSNLIASGSAKGIILWNAKTGALIRRTDSGCVNDVVFSPNSKMLGTSPFTHLIEARKVNLYDVQSGELIKSLKIDYCTACVAFSPDGKILAYGNEYDKTNDENVVHIFDINEQRVVTTLRENQRGVVSSVAFSPNGNTLAFCIQSGGFYKIKIWNLLTDESTQVLSSKIFALTRIVFSPNGRMIACGSKDNGWVKIIDVNTHKTIKTFQSQINQMEFSPNGRFFVVHDHCVFEIWDIKNKKSFFFKQQHRCTSAAYCTHDQNFSFAPNGKSIVCLNGQNKVEICDFWQPVQRKLQKYAYLLTKSCHISSLTILYIFKSILKQKNQLCVVSDQQLFEFIKTSKQARL